MGRWLENLGEALLDAASIAAFLFTLYVGAALIVGAA
jgi:hypothetical protein